MKAFLSAVRTFVQKLLSSLATLVILTAAAVLVLYLADIRPYIVTTGSMAPAIPVHSVCFVNGNIPLEQIAVGEVISFRTGEMLVTHRVAEIHGGEYITKGDANSIADAQPVTAEQYIGKTVAVIPRIGSLLIILHTRNGKIAAAALILLLILISFLPRHTPDNKSAGKEA